MRRSVAYSSATGSRFSARSSTTQSTTPCGPTSITAWIFVRFFRSLSTIARNFASPGLRVRRSPISALYWLCRRILITRRKHGYRIQRLDARGDEEEQLGGALHGFCILKQGPDNRQPA